MRKGIDFKDKKIFTAVMTNFFGWVLKTSKKSKVLNQLEHVQFSQ